MKYFLTLLILLIGLTICAALYLQQPKFGPSIDTAAYEHLPIENFFSDGHFHNLEPTEVLLNGKSLFSTFRDARKNRSVDVRPGKPLPSIKVNLQSLDQSRDLIIWLGHSSYYLQLNGLRLLIDPVLSVNAGPVPSVNSSFAGTNVYTVEELPKIDVLLISHDHWDHLDYPTIAALQPNVKQVITGLGVDQFFMDWGYSPTQILSGGWFESFEQSKNLKIHLIPARHYSGRVIKRNRTLWVGFVLETPYFRLLFSGDSGDGVHFDQIAKRFSGFDLVMLDMGQYDAAWPSIHMTPEQAVSVAGRLNAEALFPAHVGKYALANHAWYDPFERSVSASAVTDLNLLTPKIGHPILLENLMDTAIEKWWYRHPPDISLLTTEKYQ